MKGKIDYLLVVLPLCVLWRFENGFTSLYTFMHLSMEPTSNDNAFLHHNLTQPHQHETTNVTLHGISAESTLCPHFMHHAQFIFRGKHEKWHYWHGFHIKSLHLYEVHLWSTLPLFAPSNLRKFVDPNTTSPANSSSSTIHLLIQTQRNGKCVIGNCYYLLHYK